MHAWLKYCLLVVLMATPALAQDEDWPRSVVHEKGVLVIDKKPLRVVSTSPSLTGILLAIEAPLIASAATVTTALTDEKGFFTQWAEIANERGVEILYRNLDFDMEAIIALNPDLVIGSSTAADNILAYYDELQAQDIPTLIYSYSATSWQELARQMGQAVGHEQQAEVVIRDFEQRLHDVAARLQVPDAPVTIVGYNIGSSYSIGKVSSPQAKVLQALGFNIVELATQHASLIQRSSNFDFISHENLSATIEGDIVFLMRGDAKDVAAFMANPVLQNLNAVKNNQVYPLGISSFRIDYYSALEMINLIAAHFAKD